MPDGHNEAPTFLYPQECPIPEGAEILDRSGKAADSEFPSTHIGSAVLPCGKMKTWIEIQVLDAGGRPVPNRNFRLKLPTGEVRTGCTDPDGLAGFDGIDPGDCELTFDDFKFSQ